MWNWFNCICKSAVLPDKGKSNYQVIIVAVVILIESFRRYSQSLEVLTYLTLHEINMLLLLLLLP